MKKIIVSDIKWDTDGEKVELPKEVHIEINKDNEYLLDDIDDYADEVCDYLSDNYGYCIEGFCTDVIEGE